MKHIELRYSPNDLNAVATVKDTIFVVDWNNASLHAYRWDGTELGRFSKDQLGVTESLIRGIGTVGEDGLLIAAGNGLIVKNLHLCNVN